MFKTVLPWVVAITFALLFVLNFVIDLRKQKTTLPQKIQPQQVIFKPKEPTERSLKAASGLIFYSSKEVRKIFDDKFGTESGQMTRIANFLDSSKEKLVAIEQFVDYLKNDANRPVVNIENSPRTPPSIFDSVHCTTNRIGETTYTNCY